MLSRGSLFFVRLGGLFAGQQCAGSSPAAWPAQWVGVACTGVGREFGIDVFSCLNIRAKVCSMIVEHVVEYRQHKNRRALFGGQTKKSALSKTVFNLGGYDSLRAYRCQTLLEHGWLYFAC